MQDETLGAPSLTAASIVTTILLCTGTAGADQPAMGYVHSQPQDQGYAPPAQPYPPHAAATSGYGYPGQGPAPGTFGPAPPVRDDVQPGAADSEEKAEAPFVAASITTVFPLYVGGQASLELPGRFTIAADLGGMPAAYGSAINGTIQGFAGYDNSIADFVDGSFESAMVARLSAGFRPFEAAGFELWGGYTMIDVDGHTSLDEVVAAVDTGSATNEVNAVANQLGNTPVGLSSTIHAFHVGLAWRWLVADHLSIRASLGYLQALGSSSSLEIEELPEAEPLVNPSVDSTLDGVYSDYLKMPYGGLAVGYQF